MSSGAEELRKNHGSQVRDECFPAHSSLGLALSGGESGHRSPPCADEPLSALWSCSLPSSPVLPRYGRKTFAGPDCRRVAGRNLPTRRICLGGQGCEVREEWLKVWMLTLQAETSPDRSVLWQAIHAMRRLSLRQDFSRTVYFSETGLEVRRLTTEQNRRGPQESEKNGEAPPTDR
jgi:hypothetical protein